MFKAVKDFLNQVYLEMNKVSWPTYSELRGSTYLIIIFSFIFVVFLFAVDWLVGEIVSALL
jgi:preprotein translocase subunit SecE